MIQVLDDFPGFGVVYDLNAATFMEISLDEDLRRLKDTLLGDTLLTQIANARPAARSGTNGSAELQAMAFPPGVNVVFLPARMSFIETGKRRGFGGRLDDEPNDARFNLPGGKMTPTQSANRAMARDIDAAGDGSGSTSFCFYTNAQTHTSRGEANDSMVVLLHELIHCLHHLHGVDHGDDEEFATIGLGQFQNRFMAENTFRQSIGMPLRERY